MFVINITVNSDVTEQTQSEMYPVHVNGWKSILIMAGF